MIEILLIFVLPVILIVASPFFYKKRHLIFTPTLVLLIYVILKRNYSFYELGFRLDNFKDGFWPYAFFTVLALYIILVIAKTRKVKPVERWWTYPHFIYGFVVLSIVQELVYRGYLMPRLMELYTGAFTIILLNSVIFAFIHVIYPGRLRNFILSFLGGLGFAGLYYYFPNIYLVIISHIFLNFASLYFRLIGPEKLIKHGFKIA